MVAAVKQSAPTRRPVDPFTTACTVAYALLGWTLSGLGAILPELREELGGQASIYPLMPGAALVAIGLVSQAHRHTPRRTQRTAIWHGSVLLSASIALLTITGLETVSAIGAVAMGLTAAGLIRVIPAALTAHQPSRSVSVVTRANAWSSLASIAAPLTVGGAIAIGIGWRSGLVVAPVVAAIWVILLTRSDQDSDPSTVGDDEIVDGVPTETVAHPWFGAWLLLCLSIVVEFAFVYFASTYLHEEVGMSKAGAASGTAAFAVGMAASRFLAGPIRSLGSLPLPAYLATIGAGFALLWAVDSPIAAIIGITVAGAGTALLYPIGISRLLSRFHDARELGATRGALASGVALLSSPALLGALRAASNVRTAYLSVPGLLVVIAFVNHHEQHRRGLPSRDQIISRAG
jgi:hypothetical protein